MVSPSSASGLGAAGSLPGRPLRPRQLTNQHSAVAGARAGRYLKPGAWRRRRVARFDGKVAFITGGGTGIGLGCAREIVTAGGRAILAGRRADRIEAAAKELGPRADFVVCDVCSDESVDAAVAQV